MASAIALPRDSAMPYPTEQDVEERLALIDQLKSFLASAPSNWDVPEGEPPIKRHELPAGEHVSCVRWNDAFFISGTDIVRCLVFRFHAFGRPIQNMKKFEEGIFSDLRNLKPGSDAVLEEPKSSFLDLLYKHNCIRTEKKQKVFHWYSVPHDRLFLDALERDLKREKLGVEPTSLAVANPAISISLDTTQAMFDEYRKTLLSELELEVCLNSTAQLYNISNINNINNNNSSNNSSSSNSGAGSLSPLLEPSTSLKLEPSLSLGRRSQQELSISKNATSIAFNNFSLFGGSPSYKQRRRRAGSSSAANIPAFRSAPTDSSNSTPLTRNDEEGPRSFTCPLSSCGKYFKRLEHLKRHLRTHTMERPYLCNLCGKRFSRSDNLAQHKKTHTKRQKSRPNASQSDHGDSSEEGENITTTENDACQYQHQSQDSQDDKASRNHFDGNHPPFQATALDTSAAWSQDTLAIKQEPIQPQLYSSGDAYGYASSSSSCQSSPLRSAAPALPFTLYSNDNNSGNNSSGGYDYRMYFDAPNPVASLSSSTQSEDDLFVAAAASMASNDGAAVTTAQQWDSATVVDWEYNSPVLASHQTSPYQGYYDYTAMTDDEDTAGGKEPLLTMGTIHGNLFDQIPISSHDLYNTSYPYMNGSSMHFNPTMRPTDALINQY